MIEEIELTAVPVLGNGAGSESWERSIMESSTDYGCFGVHYIQGVSELLLRGYGAYIKVHWVEFQVQ